MIILSEKSRLIEDEIQILVYEKIDEWEKELKKTSKNSIKYAELAEKERILLETYRDYLKLRAKILEIAHGEEIEEEIIE
mgnify:CR=1 FL=1